MRIVRTTGKVALSRRTMVSGAALMVAVLPLAGCERLPTYRFRTVVEVETPQGLRTGSSVYEVENVITPGIPGPEAGGWHKKARGEAVAVDLPNGQTLFALLQGERGSSWPDTILYSLTPDPAPKEVDADWERRLERAVANRALIVVPRKLPGIWHDKDGPPGAYPLLVRFRNIADPASVEAVDPDDLAASFGPGYRLRRITVQITDDPVTTGIEKRLPKPQYKGFYNWDGKSPFKQADAIGQWDFSRGDKK